MALVTLAQAKRHLRIETETTDPLSAEDEDLTLKIAQAEALIVNYLGTAADEAWTEVTVPPVVQLAVLYQVAEVWRFRGDDPEPASVPHVPGLLSLFVRNILLRYRPLTLV